MTFLHPEFIYFMMPLVLILFYFLLTQAEQMHTFFSHDVLERLRVHSNRMTLKARNVLFLLMFVCIVLALAYPVIEEGKIKVQAKSADIMIALDISDSMLAEDIYPSRLKHAKQKILELLSLSPRERIGVMAFAKDAYLVAPLTFDHRAAAYLVRQLKPSFITEKGTDFLQLLHAAGTMMKEKKKKVLLIMSDGGERKDFSKEIAYSKEVGMTVFVLGIGSAKGVPIKQKDGGFVKENGTIIVTRLNNAIADLATKSGGSYIESVGSAKDIDAMMEEITRKSQKRTLHEEEIIRYIPLFYFPLGAAMLLLLIATSSMSKRERLQMPGAFIAGWLLLQGAPLRAGFMDFKLLHDAQEAYRAEEYNRSAGLYAEYAWQTRSNEALYDQANALYRGGRYNDAAKVYKHVFFADRNRQFDVLHNLGNAFARQGERHSYAKAIAAYEKALQIKEEAQTRENLERVKALLKREQNRLSQQDCKKPQKREPQPTQQNRSGKQAQKKSKSNVQNHAGQHLQQQQQDMSDKSSKSKKEKGSDENRSQEQSASQSDISDKDRQKKSAKSGRNKIRDKQGSTVEKKSDTMSDREEKKWLKMLNKQPASHIYRIETKQKREENSDARPW